MMMFTLNRLLGTVCVAAAVGVIVTFHDDRALSRSADPVTAATAPVGEPEPAAEPAASATRTGVRNPFVLGSDGSEAGQKREQILAAARAKNATLATAGSATIRRTTTTTTPRRRTTSSRELTERRTMSPFERSRHYKRNRMSYDNRDRGVRYRPSNPRVQGRVDRFRRYY